MRTSITVHHHHARHQTIARCETRGSTGPLTRSSDEAEVEVEVEAEDTRVTTLTMTVSPGMTGEAVVEEEVVDEVDTAAATVVVVEVDIRATGSRTTRTTTVET